MQMSIKPSKKKLRREKKKMKKSLLSIILAAVLVLGLAPLTADAAGQSYGLSWNNRASLDPVTVDWNPRAQTLTVQYNNTGNYFALNNTNEAQKTILLKRDNRGNFQELRGVYSRIVATGAMRGQGRYGAVTLKFYDRTGREYRFENGSHYAVNFYIIANGHRHTTPNGKEPFRFM